MTPAIIVFPGASLMDITPKPEGVRVRCPGCEAVRDFPTNATTYATFVHEDACPVHATIQAAITRYTHEIVRRG